MIRLLYFLLFSFALGQLAGAQDISDKAKYQRIIKSTDREIELLKAYITAIANKKIPEPERTRKVNRVLKKFDPEATIEVTSLRHDFKRKLPAQRYFYRLRDDLTYANVSIEWRENELITATRFKKIGDGVYELNGRYIQIYKGLDEHNQIVYGDITIKKITVKVSEQVDALTKVRHTVIRFMKIEAEATLPLDKLDELFGPTITD